ncbi:MAG: hypothetical protein OHK0029_22490 [Armatimonadaceae bacterium]
MKQVAQKQYKHPFRKRGGKSAYTLIEMMVVVSILLVLASVILPNLAAIESSRRFREQEAALLRLQREARNEALRARVPVAIRLDGGVVVMERTPLDEDPVEVRRIELTEDFKVAKTRLGNDSTDSESWAWKTYPDGSADTCGLEFEEGEAVRSLLLPAQGDGRWSDGELPEVLDERWAAGELEQRG